MALYKPPIFINNSAPPISAENLNALAGAAKANQSYQISITLSASMWSASGVQSIAVSGITATTVGFLSLAQSATLVQANAASAAIIRVTSQSNGTLSVTAYGTIPTVDIPCEITITSDGSITPSGTSYGKIVSNLSQGGRSYATYESTLTASGWSDYTQTLAITGVSAGNLVVVSPAPESAADYAEAFIICTTQAAGSLTFTCASMPSDDININIVVWG